MISTTLNAQERLDWLRLIRSDHVGPVTFHQLLQRYGSAAAALEALPELAQRGGRRDIRVWSRASAERELAAVHKLGGRLVAWGEPDYPPLLLPLEDAPPLLTLVGDAGLLRERRTIGMVGARNASAAGQKLAREIARSRRGRRHHRLRPRPRHRYRCPWRRADDGNRGRRRRRRDIVYPGGKPALQTEIATRGLLIAEAAGRY